MSHIPDGLLHAYLDGALDHLGEGESAEVRAHLDACADCRARLEGERELREAAGALLSDADPGVPAMPSFEELRRRARDTSRTVAQPTTPDVDTSPPGHKPRSGGPSRNWGLAWAATILLSLGLGWAGRGLWSVESAQMQVAAPAETQAFAPERGQESAAATTQTPLARLREDAEGTASARLDQVADRPEVAEPVQVLAVAESEEAQRPPPGDVSESLAQLRTNIARSVPAESLDDVGMRAAAGAAQEARRRVGDDEPFLADAAAPAAAPAMELTEELDRDANREPLAVPNLAILSIQPDPGVPGQPGVRILQRLHQGDTLELRYFGLLGGSEARLGTSEGVKIPMKDLPNPPLEPGWNQVILQRGSGWLVARAPMTQESLEFLLRLLN